MGASQPVLPNTNSESETTSKTSVGSPERSLRLPYLRRFFSYSSHSLDVDRSSLSLFLVLEQKKVKENDGKIKKEGNCITGIETSGYTSAHDGIFFLI